MILRAVHLQIRTDRGPCGFSFAFSRNLTVIRGGNSSGKSTFVNALLYALGLEEIIGGKGPKVLPYAVRDYFDDAGERVEVQSSEILVEIENRKGDVVTLRRPIRNVEKDMRLVEIVNGPVLTKAVPFANPRATYLHDSGSAQRAEGFHSFLESFLDLKLPRVATSSGTEVKLYLQAIFAAHAVEQKRGWTDYIANIPFYGIRDARTRVAEYILGLEIFESISLRNRLNAEAVEIDRDWRNVVEILHRESTALGFVVQNLPPQPKADFDATTPRAVRRSGEESISLEGHISQLLSEYQKLEEQLEAPKAATNSITADLSVLEGHLQELGVLYERASSSMALQKSSLIEYEDLLREANSDLERNRAALKLQQLGASQAIELAAGICPTCHQPVGDTLLRESIVGPPMDLETNISYLSSQSRMLERQIAGVKEGIQESVATLTGLASQIEAAQDHAAALRNDLGSTDSMSRAALRRQVFVQVEVERLQRLESDISKHLDELNRIAERLAQNQIMRRKLPGKQYSGSDEQRISLFEKNFRANAGSFGYESVSDIGEIEINRDSLVPGLAQIELREIRTDIKADSSASDFVRLIWSYLLGLYQTSVNPHTPGNHLGVMLFDEPGQHSMRWESQRELLLRFAAEGSLQSIVAASFDESESVFNDVTDGVRHHLISWEGKLIKPLAQYLGE